MSRVVRVLIVILVSGWALATLAPQATCLWTTCLSNGLDPDFDGVVTEVEDGSPAARAGIAPRDRIEAPLPRGLFLIPPPTISLRISHGTSIRSVVLVPVASPLAAPDRLRLFALCISYLVFLVVGSGLLLLRPNAMTWAFYFYCVFRRYGDLWFYWPGTSALFWFNFLAFASLGGASCALVLIFALRFPGDRADGWRRSLNALGLALATLFPCAWLALMVRIYFLGLPSQAIVNGMVWATSVVYLVAAAVFVVTLLQSHGDDRQRLRWVLVFPAVLLLRIVAINAPSWVPPWFYDTLIALAILIPLSVAYAVARHRVFDVQFAISRALVYGAITTIIAGTFLLLDWFLSKQFAETRFTLTAEILVALAFGSWLNLLHRNVDHFIDSTFFRARHLAEKRLSKAAAAVFRAESQEAIDRFLVHEPLEALSLSSAALFHRNERGDRFIRKDAVGWDRSDLRTLTIDDPLVLHLLAEGSPVRLADVMWSSGRLPALAGSVLAVPVRLQEELLSIALFGAHRTGADIDPDELRGIARLAERASAAYDHIEVRTLRARVETLTRKREQRV